MEEEYVPPSMRAKREAVIYMPSVRVEQTESNENRYLTEIDDANNTNDDYIPPSKRKEEEKDIKLDIEQDFPVLGGTSTINSKVNIWGNPNNLSKIKTELLGTVIKEERVVDVRPEKRLKAVFYDEELEEEQERKVEFSRLRRDMELGIVKYLDEERLYMYDEKDERSKMAFYEPEQFDMILEEECLYDEEEYYDDDYRE